MVSSWLKYLRLLFKVVYIVSSFSLQSSFLLLLQILQQVEVYQERETEKGCVPFIGYLVVHFFCCSGLFLEFISLMCLGHW